MFAMQQQQTTILPLIVFQYAHIELFPIRIFVDNLAYVQTKC